MALEPDKSGTRPQAPPDLANDGQTTLLICDDHPAYAKGLAILLQTETPDFNVIGTALNAVEALSLTQALSPDVVLMDIRMPGVDGIEATRQIKEAAPGSKVVMVTVSDEAGDLYEALRAGASGFVTKDKEVSEIAEAVRSVVRGHMVIPVDLAARFLQDISEADTTGSLTEVEEVILVGIVHGETNKEIAAALETSERTVSRRVEELYQKLNLTDRVQAAIWAAQRGIGIPKPGATKNAAKRIAPRDLKRSARRLVGTQTPAEVT